MTKNPKRASVLLALFLGVTIGDTSAAQQARLEVAWPREIPCRIHDGSNPDLLVMTLGNVDTALADGWFDPAKDQVRLKDGTVRTNYYRDILGVKFYEPLNKSRYPGPPSGWCSWYYYYNRITAEEVKRNADWIAQNLKDYGARYVQIDDGWQGNGARDSARLCSLLFKKTWSDSHISR